MITVKDFCEGQQLSKQGVYAKIKRNAEKLKGHVTKSGGVYVLDDFAVEFLKRRPADYPLLEKCCKLQTDYNTIKMEYEAESNSYARRFRELTELKKELAAEKSKCADLENQVAALTEEKKKSDEIIQSTLKENLILSENQQDLLTQIRVLNDKNTEINNKLSDFSEKNIALTNQVSDLTQKNEKLTNDVSERDEKIAELENKIAELEAAAPKKKNKFFS